MARTSLMLLTLALTLLAGSPVAAAEPFGVALLRPDSLAGWDYGAKPPAGWTIAQGRLAGDGRSTPLVSGFSFGDFELRFQWSAASGAAWQVAFPEVPQGEGLALRLGEGDGCGELKDGGAALAPGKALTVEGKSHTAVIRRDAGTLRVSVDGRQLAQAKVKPERRFGLGLALSGGEGTLADLRVQEPPGEPIFNGTNLDGWWTPGNRSAWTAQEGCLVLSKDNGNYLRTKKQFANFTLTLEYRMAKGGNSGIGIRTPPAGWPSSDGMELQWYDTSRNGPLDKHAEMAIYGNVPPLARADRSEQWNRVVVKADGRVISAWVNGELVQHCNTLHHPELKHRHLAGWIGFQDHGAKIEVRDIRVREAPAGLGLAAWQRPAAPSGATALLDRLMNSERVSLDDGIHGGAVTKSVPAGAGSTTLAELTGPGAVVRIARTGDEGRLAFYFDGEQKPRLQCRPADLVKSLPHVTEDAGPVLTCLTYAKGLKIVLQGKSPRAVAYRLDYVTLPPNLPVETFTSLESGFPRGWLSAVGYRRDQCGWGGHRENEPMPRSTAQGKTIPPGKTVPMIEVPGSGVVLWVKLVADKRVLDSNDLWLEATVDGEPRPAVSCPVRFWFPGLAGQGNYPNFVLVDRGGPTNLLAMPFGRGIRFALANRGTKPIRGVGLAVSVDPGQTPEQGPADRMRLRAVFEPAGQGEDLLRQAGPGRWVGLVYESRDKQRSAFGPLRVDGRPSAGWTVPDLDLFLGRAGDFRSCASGRHGRLAWRYLLLEPVDFRESLRMETSGQEPPDRLAIYYGR